MNSPEWLPDWLKIPLMNVSNGIRVWIVGGAVRDTLLGLEKIDFDFAVEHDARSLARAVANALNGYYYELDDIRDTGRVIFIDKDQNRHLLDFARIRGGSIEADLQDRDFTINALSVELGQPEKIIDPTGGLQDLKDKILRNCSPTAILNDPIRGLRAVRISIQLGLTIEPNTIDSIRRHTSRLIEVSPERIRDELFRMLGLPQPGKAIRLMDHLGYVSVLWPQLDPLRKLAQPPPHEFLAWDHTLATVDHLGKILKVLNTEYDPKDASDLILGEIIYRLGRFREGICQYLEQELSLGRNIRQLLFLGTLFHDSGKPTSYSATDNQIHFYDHEEVGVEITSEMARSLHLSNKEIQWLELLIRNHMRPTQLGKTSSISNRAIHRFLRDTDNANVAVILLSLADMLGKQTPPLDQEVLSKRLEILRQLLSAIFEAAPEKYNPKPFLNGKEIAEALEMEPGPEIGRLLNALQEAQITGEITSKAEAYAWIRSLPRKENSFFLESDEEEKIS